MRGEAPKVHGGVGPRSRPLHPRGANGGKRGAGSVLRLIDNTKLHSAMLFSICVLFYLAFFPLPGGQRRKKGRNEGRKEGSKERGDSTGKKQAPMLFLWSSYAFPMLFLCFSRAFALLVLCFSYAFLMLFLFFVRCFSYAVVTQM